MLENIFYELPNETRFFIGVILLLSLYYHIRFTERAVNLAPTILTTLGIFATFFAIAVGLHGFDTQSVEKSVPKLLDGLKTAFWASVFGVGAALTIKMRYYFAGVKALPIAQADDEVSAKDLVETLRAIHWSLAGDQDATLISQIKLMRSDINDRLDTLKKAQEESLRKLSEMGTKEIIKALEGVIRDFNDKITEQFGDNFKQLNEAIGKLLVWQDNYKSHLEATEMRHKEIVSSMTIATQNYTSLLEKADGFTRVSTDLAAMLSKLEEQKGTLERMLTSLAEMLKTASSTIPQFEMKITQIAQQIQSAAENQQKLLADILTESGTALKRAIEVSVEQSQKLHETHSAQIVEMTKKTKEQIAALDSALSDELQKSLESLGRQLTALSNKFVEDYTPLTESLRKLVTQLGRV